MDPIDNELKKELAEGPLTRNGFNESLRGRIKSRLEEKTGERKKRMPWLAAIGAGALALTLFLSGVWNHKMVPAAGDTLRHGKMPTAGVASAGTDLAKPSRAVVRSAFLVGLRTDHQAESSTPAYSSYRTLLVAPEADQPQLVAEGSGILMPYKQNFWKIDAELTREGSEQSETLTADQASRSPSLLGRTEVPDKPLKLDEKLMFAGNRYVAVDQQTVESAGGHEIRSEYAWVKEVTQLAGTAKRAPAPAQEPHISLLDVLGSAAVQTAPSPAPFIAAGESWTIARKPGHWTAMQAEYLEPANNEGYRFTLKEVPAALPDSVVSHDELSLNWNEILRMQPKAEDAFVSPDKDMAVVVAEGSLLVYPLGNEPAKEPALKLSLAPNESIVMSQWATDSYVEQWKREAKTYLKK